MLMNNLYRPAYRKKNDVFSYQKHDSSCTFSHSLFYFTEPLPVFYTLNAINDYC